MRRALAALLVLAAGLAGCTQTPGGPGDLPDCPPVPERTVGVSVEGVEANLTEAEVHDAPEDLRTATSIACPAAEKVAVLPAPGPDAAQGTTTVAEVDEVWLRFETGLLRAGTNLTVQANGTLRVQADGPPVREANLTWSDADLPVRWTEWYDDPTALDPPRVGFDERVLRNETGNLSFPVNSSRSEVAAVVSVDLNESRYRRWTQVGGSRALVQLTLQGPNGTVAARGNWTAADGSDWTSVRVHGPAEGNWTLRYRADLGSQRPGAFRYSIGAEPLYGGHRGSGLPPG